MAEVALEVAATQRKRRPILVWLLAAVLILAAVAAAWALMPGPSRVRTFDPTELGRAEAKLWRDYYDRKAVSLAVGLVLADNRSFGLAPLTSLRSGLAAAGAARTFQASTSREGAKAALPALTEHFRIFGEATGLAFDPAVEARLELEWWQKRREADDISYAPEIAAAAAYLYDAPADWFAAYARLRAEAMDLRDRKDAAMTDADWREVERLLIAAYREMRTAISAA